MPTLTSPFEIARETLRQLAARSVPPTPDNYLTLYQEISGVKVADSAFPEKHLRSLAAALPRVSPEQLRLARQLDEAVKDGNWDEYRNRLVEFVNALAESQKLGWSEMIGNLIRQWDAKPARLTVARKRESLEHVLTSSAANPDRLFTRLQSLLRSWGQGRDQEGGAAEESAPTDTANVTAPQTRTATLSTASDLLPELRELFAFTLETAIATQLLESPQLSSDAKALAQDIRSAGTPAQLQEFLTRLKRFAFKLELLAEDQTELRQSLLGLLRLLVGNITELVLDDHWLHGQIEVVREIIDKPLSQRALDDAESRLKEVLFKQAELIGSLSEARDAIKHMLAGF